MIIGVLSKPHFCDHCSLKSNRLGYAHLLIEMTIYGDFSQHYILEDDFGSQMIQKVVYEWKVEACSICKELEYFKRIVLKQNLNLKKFGKKMPTLLAMITLRYIL